VTLATIARTVGVHVSTVSRALSPDERARNSVAPVTAAQIRAAAEALDYRPNLAGAALRTGRSRLLGVLVPRLTDIVLAGAYEGIDRAAAEAGYFTFVSNTEDDLHLQRDRVRKTLDRGVDGLLLADARSDSDLYRELRDQGVPLVLFYRRLPDFVSVTVDDVEGGRLVAEHLCDAGHTDLAVVGGPRHASTARDRCAGFLEECARRGVEVPAERVLHSGFGVEDGRAAAERLLAQRPWPSAVFAVNDFAAIGAMGAIRDAGLETGRDIALVGYNDVPLAAELPIPLSSVRVPLHEVGERAVATMLDLLAGGSPASIRLAPTLQVRGSSSTTKETA
jgi:LacI family transcriptional regulator